MSKTYAALFLSLALLLPGCAVAPFVVGPAVSAFVVWKDGEGVKYYEKPSYELYHALKIILHRLGHSVDSDDIKAGGHFYLHSKSQNHSFKITVVQADQGVSALKIRIDFMGDRPYAELVFKAVDEQLGVK